MVTMRTPLDGLNEGDNVGSYASRAGDTFSLLYVEEPRVSMESFGIALALQPVVTGLCHCGAARYLPLESAMKNAIKGDSRMNVSDMKPKPNQSRILLYSFMKQLRTVVEDGVGREVAY